MGSEGNTDPWGYSSGTEKGDRRGLSVRCCRALAQKLLSGDTSCPMCGDTTRHSSRVLAINKQDTEEGPCWVGFHSPRALCPARWRKGSLPAGTSMGRQQGLHPRHWLRRAGP